MESVTQTVPRSQKTIDRARIRWMAREREALRALLKQGTFKGVFPPFHSLDVHPLVAFRVPRYVSINVFADMDARAGLSVFLRDSPRFDKCDVPIGKSVKGARELLRRYLTHYPERPASFQDLAASDIWKTFAGPNGDAPRLMLPGVMISFGSGEPLIPIIDYTRPESSDAPDHSLAFILRAIRPSQLRWTGARALFVAV